ncbi:unnamed protein product [Microthlaspi erraticum]|uniref:Uncharacterized protein n=1 Tax=Microthlaspi erraticum TaxID=1685480 RepID=A0A6D2LBI3_9BRAS|nr:unnamed protein product [Microthlaspi erraticum]
MSLSHKEMLTRLGLMEKQMTGITETLSRLEALAFSGQNCGKGTTSSSFDSPKVSIPLLNHGNSSLGSRKEVIKRKDPEGLTKHKEAMKMQSSVFVSQDNLVGNSVEQITWGNKITEAGSSNSPVELRPRQRYTDAEHDDRRNKICFKYKGQFFKGHPCSKR